MEIKNKKWDKNEKEFRTRMNHYQINDARKFVQNYDNDPEYEKRKEKQFCKVCYYTSEMAFQAFTDTNCGKCDEKMTFPSSYIDKLCMRCATMTESCKHCGGEID